MSHRAAAGAALLLAALSLVACGNGDGDEVATAAEARQFAAGRALPPGLARSVEAQVEGFLAREGTALREGLRPFLGKEMTTGVERGSAVCRPGSETPSIADPRRNPFACIVRGEADAHGLQIEITLGFVGTELGPHCWKAANERVMATTTAPELLGRDEALRPVNQISGCLERA